MRYVGRVAEWNDEKGYGFAAPNGGGDRAFVHIKSFVSRGQRPVDGDLISYEIESDTRRRLNAKGIRFVANRDAPQSRPLVWFPRRVVGVLALAILGSAAYLGRVPPIVPVIYASMSVIAFLAYGLDKSAARTHRWRTPESTLHFFELLGGWPGALIAQGSFRHKTRKFSYQLAFWLIVAINLGILSWLIRSGKIELLSQMFQHLLNYLGS